MASGFDAAAGAVGFASLGVLLLQGCVKGFVLLRTAQNFGNDADIIRSEIEYQQYRLFAWAERTGLGNGSPTRNMNWEIVHGHLKKLESLLTDTTRFKSNYRLEIISTEDKLSQKDLLVPKKGFRRLFKSEFHNDTARKLQEGVTVWKRLKWAAMDKDGIGMLIGDIRRFVDGLWDLLRDDDLHYIRNTLESLQRHAISQSHGQTALSHIEAIIQSKPKAISRFEDGAITSALFLKKQSLMLAYVDGTEVDTSESPVISRNSVSSSLSGDTLINQSSSGRNSMVSFAKKPKTRDALSYRLLELGPDSDQEKYKREVARYDGKPVIVEWKNVEGMHDRALKHRIKTLATLLQDIDSDSFHSLKCIGYLKDPKSDNYGYVFRPPDGSSKFVSLHSLLDDHDLAPSLDDRLAIATGLVETVLQLHTAGWLHKGLRSENVIFFQARDGSLNITQVFLEGYEYARADNPSDMTEAPINKQEANLYRHPALLRVNRSSFCKAFDLYGLGCVLAEIGLWEGLTTTLLHFSRNGNNPGSQKRMPQSTLTYQSSDEVLRLNEMKARLLIDSGEGSIENALSFAAGNTYASVVRACLSAGDKVADPGVQVEDIEVEEERCLDLELEILGRLRKCKG